jgi:hypothetical protein
LNPETRAVTWPHVTDGVRVSPWTTIDIEIPLIV